MKPDLSGIRGIVFDLDGTLIDSYEAIAQSLNHALAGLGRPALPVERIRTMVGRGLETLIAEALGDGQAPVAATDPAVAEGVRLFRARYDAICVGKTTLLPGVLPTLSELHARGYRMSVATNKPSYFARRLLEALGVGGCLDVVMGPDLVERPKPDPQMVLAALDAMQVARDEALYVGDMEIDVETARAAGLRVIVMPTGSRSLPDLQAAGADLVVAGFDALRGLLPGPKAERRS